MDSRRPIVGASDRTRTCNLLIRSQKTPYRIPPKPIYLTVFNLQIRPEPYQNRIWPGDAFHFDGGQPSSKGCHRRDSGSSPSPAPSSPRQSALACFELYLVSGQYWVPRSQAAGHLVSAIISAWQNRQVPLGLRPLPTHKLRPLRRNSFHRHARRGPSIWSDRSRGYRAVVSRYRVYPQWSGEPSPAPVFGDANPRREEI